MYKVIFVLTLLVLPFKVWCFFDTDAQRFILIDPNTGQTLVEKNSGRMFHAGTFTHVMSAVTVFEMFNDGLISLKDKLSLRLRDSGLHAKVALRDLLRSLISGYSEEASATIARWISGDTREYATMMTEVAEYLGQRIQIFLT